eukprot:5186220-Pleurochrysis_carterae.AAC.2
MFADRDATGSQRMWSGACEAGSERHGLPNSLTPNIIHYHHASSHYHVPVAVLRTYTANNVWATAP